MSIPINKSSEPTKYMEATPNNLPTGSWNPLIEGLGKQLLGTEAVSGSLEDLPHEILERIFDNLRKNMGMGVLHQQLPFVSKIIHANFQGAVNHWINQGHINFSNVGCKTVKVAVRYMMHHNPLRADFFDYLDLDGEDLINLSISCPDIILLNLQRGTFTEDELAEAIGAFTNLQTLTLISMKFPLSDKFTKALGALTHLRELNLWYRPRFSNPDSFAEALTNLTNLERLVLDNQYLSTKIPDAFKNLTKLTTLGLRHCSPAGTIFVEDKKVLPELKSLNLLLSKISGDQLITVAKTHPKLEELNIFSCSQIPSAQVVEALGWLPKLRNLNIGFCDTISGDQLITIAQGCPNLQRLDMRHFNASIDQIRKCLNSLIHLKTLDLGLSNISKEEMEVLVNQFPNIKFEIY